jgi:hypothetical protein
MSTIAGAPEFVGSDFATLQIQLVIHAGRGLVVLLMGNGARRVALRRSCVAPRQWSRGVMVCAVMRQQV